MPGVISLAPVFGFESKYTFHLIFFVWIPPTDVLTFCLPFLLDRTESIGWDPNQKGKRKVSAWDFQDVEVLEDRSYTRFPLKSQHLGNL